MSQYTPLLWDAVLKNDTKKVKFYLEHQASVDGVDREGVPLIVRGVETGNPNIVRLLLGYGAPSLMSSRDGKKSPLWVAVSKGYTDIIRLLLDEDGGIVREEERLGRYYGRTGVLLDAAEDGNVDIVDILLNAGANPNLENVNKETALIRAKTLEIVDRLIEGGADVDHTDIDGFAAIDWFASENNLPIVQRLLEAGANPSRALFSAVKNQNRRMTELLLDAGATPTPTFTPEMNAYITSLRRLPLIALRQEELARAGRRRRKTKRFYRRRK